MTEREELANFVTHGAGAVAALAGAAVLIVLASVQGSVWEVVGFSVFATSLVALYSASTLYHAVRDVRLKARLKLLDHAAIYLLIAGTYTPFMVAEAGTPFYHGRRLPYSHAIWHVFVVAGSVCHGIAVGTLL